MTLVRRASRSAPLHIKGHQDLLLFAILQAGAPVSLGAAVAFLFFNQRDRWRPVPASSFRCSFDFNNDGDFTDPGEVQDGTNSSARYAFSRRGWHDIHGRVRSLDGRFTDFWLRVFVP